MSAGAPSAAVEAPATAQLGARWLLGRTFSIWGRNAIAITLACAVPYAPMAAVWALPAFGISLDALKANALVEGAVRFSMMSIVQIVAAGTVASAAVEQLRGSGRGGPGMLLAALARRGPALLSLAIVETLILLVALGAFVVPGIWARLVLFVAAPALSVEGCGVADALRRSRELTRGRLGALLAAVVGLGVVAQVIDTGATALIGAIADAGSWLGWTLRHAVAAFTIGPTAVASAVAYDALRTANEGQDGGALARVFE